MSVEQKRSDCVSEYIIEMFTGAISYSGLFFYYIAPLTAKTKHFGSSCIECTERSYEVFHARYQIHTK